LPAEPDRPVPLQIAEPRCGRCAPCGSRPRRCRSLVALASLLFGAAPACTACRVP
jgi:hypothetical protein